MIKRRFYKIEHGDKSGSLDSSSADDSDSDFDSEVGAEDIQVEKEEEEEDQEQDEEQRRVNDVNVMRYPSPCSGYLSEDSSNNDGGNDASESGVKDKEAGNSAANISDDFWKPCEMTKITVCPNDPIHEDFSKFILKFKSVFKCRLCPRILCLNEGSVRTHLASKRHTRSRKLFREGRLKLMLNSDGELEEEQETHAERHARILALSQASIAPKKKNNGRQRQHRRRTKRMRSGVDKAKLDAPTKSTPKKRRTTEAI